jgi:photosystem II stability/assembly factor-like uncharacterized protein
LPSGFLFWSYWFISALNLLFWHIELNQLKMKQLGTFLFTLCLVLGVQAQQLDMTLFEGIHPRSIGPAGMSGRVTAIDVNLSNPEEMYVGTASGGLWKTEGGGVAWTPIFDSLEVASIGAVAINQQNPDVIWVGTGEGNPRNSQTSGGGIYRSLDGGRSWERMGLEKTRNIHRIIIHRDNPDIIYVGAIGYAWGDSEHRGVYRTKDGGKNWEKILYLSERTGAADFDVDPSNPNKLFVNMWEYRRWPWFFKSGGPNSGLYVTLDGGDTWTKRIHKDGLPKGDIGKVGIAIAPSNPDVVYALVESKKNALYRSDDGGFKWQKVADKNIGDRPFYYADIAVDPTNENRVYNVFSNVTVSEDGGKTFKTLLGWDNIHGDHHYWWIHPEDPNFMIDGNDGGMAITRDRGKSWRFVENLPLAQFYHIQVDDAIPYNVYGGMQDNGTWRGPSQAWQAGGITNAMWDEIGFGDGFDVVISPEPGYAFVMWQGGNLLRVNYETGAQQWIKPQPPRDSDTPLRFNWNAGIAQDPFDEYAIYYGSQFLHHSIDQGNSWSIMSPDLTTNDPEKQRQKESGGLTFDVTGAENHCTILSIAPSPADRDVIWVGTDDGNIQLTKDGGKTWSNVGANLRGVERGSWVAQLHASPTNAKEVVAVINDYRRDNWAPYLMRTRDYGKTWTNMVSDKKVDGYCLSWVQDSIATNLQFLGTEYGLYVTIDDGKNWTKWTSGYPTVSTIDMKIHPREHDLVIGTFGRSAYILDDIRPLRQLAQTKAATLDSALVVFPIPDAHQVSYRSYAGTRFTGNAYYAGEDRPYGALLSFYVKDIQKKDKEGNVMKSDTATIEIWQDNDRIRRFKTKVTKGMNRTAWGLEKDGIRMPTQPKPKEKDAVAPGGRSVLPGTYEVRVLYGDQQAARTVNVIPDKRINIDQVGVQNFYKNWDNFNKSVRFVTLAMDHLREAKALSKSISSMVQQQVTDEETLKMVKDTSAHFTKTIDSLMALVTPGPEVQGIYRDPALLENRISDAMMFFNPAFGTPNPAFHEASSNQMEAVRAVERELDTFLDTVDDFFQKDWKTYEAIIDKLELDITKPIRE